MTNQQRADEFLQMWQQQRAAGIPPEDRISCGRCGGNCQCQRLEECFYRADDAFSRDLEVIRAVMERS